MARGFTFAAGPLPVHWRMLHRPVSLFRYSRHLLNAAVALSDGAALLRRHGVVGLRLRIIVCRC